MARITAANIGNFTEASTQGNCSNAGSLDVGDVDKAFRRDVLDTLKGKTRKAVEQAYESLPDNMELIPLYYTKIDPADTAATMDEFLKISAPVYMTYLAENHRDQLVEAGFCEHAVDMMAKGLAPTDSDGKPYNYDIDHIVERGGGGLMSLNSSEDPDAPETDMPEGETLEINHIQNLFFLPREVHEMKNTINRAQLKRMDVGETALMYMAVPKRDENPSPFFVPNGGFGPEKNTSVDVSFLAAGEAVRADFLIDRLEHRAQKLGVIEAAPSGSDVVDMRAQFQKVAEIPHGQDAEVDARYDGINANIASMCTNWTTVVASLQGQTDYTKGNPNAAGLFYENFTGLERKLRNFVDHDGRSLAPDVQPVGKAVHLALVDSQLKATLTKITDLSNSRKTGPAPWDLAKDTQKTPQEKEAALRDPDVFSKKTFSKLWAATGAFEELLSRVDNVLTYAEEVYPVGSDERSEIIAHVSSVLDSVDVAADNFTLCAREKDDAISGVTTTLLIDDVRQKIANLGQSQSLHLGAGEMKNNQIES